MKIKSKKKTILISILILAVILIAAAGVFWLKNNEKKPEETSKKEEKTLEIKEETSKKEEKTQTETKNETSKSTQEAQKDIATNSDKPEPATIDKTTNKYRVNITVNAFDTASDVRISGIINAPIQEGKCNIQLVGPSQEVQNIQTDILTAPTTAHCKAIHVSKANLKKGLWKYKIIYENSNTLGESNENTFEI